MIDDNLVRAFRAACAFPGAPVVRGTRTTPTTFFQRAKPSIRSTRRCRASSRSHGPVRGSHRTALPTLPLHGHPNAERVAVAIGSACEVLDETAAYLNDKGEKVGVLQVALYRPWSTEDFMAAMPRSVKAVAVLDRTKEAVRWASHSISMSLRASPCSCRGKLPAMPKLIGGRYGLSSKDFDPAMAKAVFDELRKTSRSTASPSASSTTFRIPVSTTSRHSTSRRPTSCARSSTGLGPTVLSERTRIR
jgi:pyruvate-ferredoxin/flavodoxin oxidoreductase